MNVRVIPWWMSDGQVELVSEIVAWMAAVMLAIVVGMIVWHVVVEPIIKKINWFRYGRKRRSNFGRY